MADSNLHKWDRWYHGVTLDEPQQYGDSTTYEMGAEWLKDCLTVEDWGCGKGGFGPHLSAASGGRAMYMGLDGSETPFTSQVVDLVEYTNRVGVEGIFMRHVLEHDYRWREILTNAAHSFTKRFFLVLFTPLQNETREIAWNPDPGVPDIGFDLQDIIRIVSSVVGDTVGGGHIETDIKTNTQYGSETILAFEKL